MASPASATATATYDLMLLLDVAAEDRVRAGVLKDVQGSITANGELLRHDRWGTRELAYPIMHKKQAEYHLLQFRPSSTALLESLDRSLRITDGVIRFRIVRLKPGTPEPPPPPPAGQTTESPAAESPAEGAAQAARQESAAGEDTSAPAAAADADGLAESETASARPAEPASEAGESDASSAAPADTAAPEPSAAAAESETPAETEAPPESETPAESADSE